MSAQIANLYQLQQIDTEILQAKRRLVDVVEGQKESETVRAARAAVQAAAAALEKWQKQQRERNQALQDIKNKQKQTEDQLYSGSVKNPKALTDLQLSLDSLGRQRAKLEDELLEAMIMVDDTAAANEAATAAWQEIETAWQQEQARLQQEQGELVARIKKLQQNRQQQIAIIDADLLTEYERLIRKQRNGIAVVALKQNMCQGCRVVVSANKVREAAEGQLVYCGSCGRILHPA
ncbi:MAG: hypothetical protein Fur0021_01310 [Candidatus Promineifilaceae bacterium]